MRPRPATAVDHSAGGKPVGDAHEERVDSDVVVTINDDLVAVYAFDRLTSVGGTVELFGNPSLASLPQFPALESAGTVRLLAGPALELIAGLNALTSIQVRLRIDVSAMGQTVLVNGFYAVTSIGFPVLPSFGVIYLCPSLQAIDSDVFNPPPCVNPD